MTRALSIRIADGTAPLPVLTSNDRELSIAMSPSTSWSEVVSRISEAASPEEVARLRSLFESPDAAREFETSPGVVIIREPRVTGDAG